MTAEKSDILYLGDTSLDGAAGYLTGLMSLWKLRFDYVPGDQHYEPSGQALEHRLFILSDYPSKNCPPVLQQMIADAVGNGAGLLMIGGWESFYGLGGDWAGTIVANVLPVMISSIDDRINCDQPALLRHSGAEHPITSGLPWDQRPPTVGGFNRITPKPSCDVLLQVERFDACLEANSIRFERRDVHPMLIVGRHGRGRSAALATDVAPHWVGGLVDWSDDASSRVVAQAPGSWTIEVGNLYAKFFEQLIHWTGSF